jgi:3-oxoacyl-[acyl-carrier protein] reductase
VTVRWPPDLLADDVAVVTGAGRGIGFAVARELLAAGARVALLEREPDRLEQATAELAAAAGGDRVGGFAADVRDRAAVDVAVAAVQERFGPVSILVNNAGVTRDAYLRRMTHEQFDEVVDVHLRGTFTMVKACLESMIEKGRGSIVSLSSSTGPYGNPGQANYGSAKAGIIGFTRTAAVELARFGIRANAIAPGAIDTPMLQAIGEERVQSFLELIPLRRLGDPREVAHTAVFLASPFASYVTGHVLFVDGGSTVAG